MRCSCVKLPNGGKTVHIDAFDRRLLAHLQEDARLTNNELSERINLSASQCSRRRIRLEEEGIIRAYRAELDREKLDLGIVIVVTVTLSTHNRDNAVRFARLISNLPEVLEAYSLTGEMDYIIKVVVPNLKALSAFVNDVLLPHESVSHVKTAIVLDTLKETTALPL
ncbi:Lrp/AsnC family transcriptional regulator [Shinella sp. NM-101]|uniref:Lrp/AsnC family transcriptional regulator n=1 Tax=Shinella sp. NM-101 TaxID=2744455 RepID=UPI001F359087|nr:Lrp/AsnC family transcriptional regulator [Shinella sp. NM-101]